MPKRRCKLLKSLKTKNCIDVTNTRWHFLWTMFSACTSIKVAVLLNKIADLPKEHSALSTPYFTFSFFFSGFHAAAVRTCSHCRLVLAYTYHSFLIHSSADGHLGCFHVLAIINSAPLNIGVHVSLSDLVSSVCMPRSGIAGSLNIFIFASDD